MFHSKLFVKTFLIIFFLTLAFAIASYLLITSAVDDVVSNIEEDSSKTVLNNVHQLVSQIEREIRGYRQTAIESRQRELRNIIAMSKGVIEMVLTECIF